jgi:solute carrier family 25 folate transporter 32
VEIFFNNHSMPRTKRTITGTKATDQALAGFTAGAISSLVLHPLDLLKTKMQVNELKIQRFESIRIISNIVKQNGIRGLYVGLGPNFVGATASWGLYFYWYSRYKDYFKLEDGKKLTFGDRYKNSSMGGAVVSCLMNPLWVNLD